MIQHADQLASPPPPVVLPAGLFPPPALGAPQGPSQAVIEQFQRLTDDHKALGAQLETLGKAIGGPLSKGDAPSRLEIFHGYIGVFFVAFLVALVATPVMRRLAIAHGIIDRPDEVRKTHRAPIAYLGGVGVFLGIMAGIFFSYTAPWHGLIAFHKTTHLTDTGIPLPVPLSIVFGLGIIMLTGLFDDVMDISPWQKVGGQLLAAAFLAMENVGVKVAAQLLYPVGVWLGHGQEMVESGKLVLFSFGIVEFDVVYWTGTAIIAVFVLGACNASNLVDGLDGLLSGVTTISTAALLVVALGLAAADGGELDAARIVLCLAVIGGCMGFLPHNFNPAVIFLGDCGSLLLGYATIVVVLTLGNEGRTDLVLAGLVIYAVPILDTALAIIRRKLSGKSIADADDQHLHHMFKRALGVKGAVFSLYGIAALFAVLGILLTMSRARVTYAITLVIALFIATIAIKVARRKAIEEQALAGGNPSGGTPQAPPAPPVTPRPTSPAPPAAPAPARA